MKKKGDEKYYLIISLILAIIVIGLVAYFVFNEYFTQEDANRETCRQSIVLRGFMPADYISEGKESFPLKCRTEPYVISTNDKQKAAKQIADIAANCFYMTGEGKLELFPRDAVSANTYCIICASVSIDDKLKDYYSKQENKIPIWGYLRDNKVAGQNNYLDYIYSNLLNHPFVKKDCPNLKSSSDSFFKNEFYIPDYFDNTNKNVFIVMSYLSKGKVVTDSLPMGFGSLSCSTSYWPTGLWQQDPPLYAFYVSQDLDKISKECDFIRSIPPK